MFYFTLMPTLTAHVDSENIWKISQKWITYILSLHSRYAKQIYKLSTLNNKEKIRPTNEHKVIVRGRIVY